MNDLLKPFIVQRKRNSTCTLPESVCPVHRNDNDALRKRRDFSKIGARCVPVSPVSHDAKIVCCLVIDFILQKGIFILIDIVPFILQGNRNGIVAIILLLLTCESLTGNS